MLKQFKESDFNQKKRHKNTLLKLKFRRFYKLNAEADEKPVLEIRNKHENKHKDRKHYLEHSVRNINIKDSIKQKNPGAVDILLGE